MLLMWNQFNIALISKFERPTSMRDLKPIALHVMSIGKAGTRLFGKVSIKLLKESFIMLNISLMIGLLPEVWLIPRNLTYLPNFCIAGYFKCNADASFHPQDHKTGMGYCFWDDSGTFVAARTSWSIGPLASSAMGF